MKPPYAAPAELTPDAAYFKASKVYSLAKIRIVKPDGIARVRSCLVTCLLDQELLGSIVLLTADAISWPLVPSYACCSVDRDRPLREAEGWSSTAGVIGYRVTSENLIPQILKPSSPLFCDPPTDCRTM
jgi:hypothetical protein